MSGFVDTRKRSRDDDFPCESTPLSKRINNLHINYEDVQWNDNSSNSSSSTMPPQSSDNNNYVNSSGLSSAQESQSGTSTTESIDQNHQYNPELDQEQNPFYYVKNKLLHDLHIQRLKRATH